jgi:hypothetical protein
VIQLPVFLVNDKNCTKIVNKGVMKTRPSQQNKTNIFPRNNSERSNATSQSIQVFLRNNIYLIFITVAYDKFFSLARFTSCHCCGPNIFRPNSQKKCEKLKSVQFLAFTKKTGSGITLKLRPQWLQEDIPYYFKIGRLC